MYTCVFLFIYTHNKYTDTHTEHTYIMYTKIIFWMWLIAINLTDPKLLNSTVYIYI